MRKNSHPAFGGFCLRHIAALAIFCLAASGFLGIAFNLPRPKALHQGSLEEKKSLREVFPSAVSFEAVKENNDILYYKALGKKNNILGFVFKTSKKGYSSDIVTMAGVSVQGIITRIEILSQNETPVLGSKITQPLTPWFTTQFSGKKADELDRSVDAVTGATVSSRAVIDSVQEKAKEILVRTHGG
jgi:electron transport complex protein RnfG